MMNKGSLLAIGAAILSCLPAQAGQLNLPALTAGTTTRLAAPLAKLPVLRQTSLPALAGTASFAQSRSDALPGLSADSLSTWVVELQAWGVNAAGVVVGEVGVSSGRALDLPSLNEAELQDYTANLLEPTFSTEAGLTTKVGPPPLPK
jgi:hypothetical protein